MAKSEVGLDIPELTGYTMHRQIITDLPRLILLSFFKVSQDRSLWIDVDIVLVNARMGEATFDFGKSFPPMVSYRIESHSINDDLTNTLHVDFENGGISFSYEKALYIKQVSSGPGPSSSK